MNVYKETGTVENVIFHKILKDYPGGVSVDPSELGENSEVLKKGTMLSLDWANKKAHIVKTAKVYAAYDDSADSQIQVDKGHEFKVGDYVYGGTDDEAITSIDRSNADYDILNFDGTASLGADLSADQIIEAGSGSNAAEYTVDVLCAADIYVHDKTASNVFVPVVLNGMVYQNALPYWIDDGTTVSDHIGTLEPQITFL